MPEARGRELRQAFETKEQELAELSAHVDAAEHRRLTLIRELEELDIYLGHRVTFAHWLSYRIGLSPGAAREHIRVARALGELPRIDEAMRLGELSYSKVRALTRVATPENEEAILFQARVATAAQLEKICRGVARVKREKGEPVCEERDRWVSSHQTEDGMVLIQAKLLPDEASLVMKALEAVQREAEEREQRAAREAAAAEAGEAAAAEGVSSGSEENAEAGADVPAETRAGSDGDVPAETRPELDGDVPAETRAGSDGDLPAETRPSGHATPAIRMNQADALVHVAETVLASSDWAEPRTPAERHQIVVAITPSVLVENSLQVTMDDGTRVSAETLRRLACDAGLIPAAVDEKGKPLDVGRRTRSIPVAVARALRLRDGGCCQFPGCTHRAWLEGHHVESWLDGGETKLSNLLLLCRACHRRIHEGAYSVTTQADGSFLFRDPDGRVLERSPTRDPLPPGAVAWLTGWNREAGLAIDAETGRAQWDGTQVDYRAAMEALL